MVATDQTLDGPALLQSLEVEGFGEEDPSPSTDPLLCIPEVEKSGT